MEVVLTLWGYYILICLEGMKKIKTKTLVKISAEIIAESISIEASNITATPSY
jgi:hypothetical protein